MNTASTPQVSTFSSTSRLREIGDPLSWVFSYLSFVAAKVEHKETRDLLAYGQIIIELARKHAGSGWGTYDSLFRQLVNAGADLMWTDLNASLMAATFLSARAATEGGRMCPLCMASDHLAQDCALASLESQRQPWRQTTWPKTVP